MNTDRIFAPEEIGAGPAAFRQNVEYRLNELKATIGLFMLVTRGLERADDLGMDTEAHREAYTRLSTLSDDAWKHVQALAAAFKDNDALFLKAPSK